MKAIVTCIGCHLLIFCSGVLSHLSCSINMCAVFDAYAEAKANTYSMVQFETNRYSVPVKYIGEKVLIRASVDTFDILHGHNLIATHSRVYERHQERLVLDHYLELLLMKSRALGNTRVYRPECLSPVYEQYRRCLAARKPNGNRDFVKILILNREHPSCLVTDAIDLALAYNVYNHDGILNILIQLKTESPNIVPLKPEAIVNIPKVNVAPPNLSKYASLLPNGVDHNEPSQDMLIEAYFKKLKMPQASKVYLSMAREAENNNLSYEDYLLGVLEQEITQRENNRIQRGIRQASFPVIKTLDSFDFKAIPSLNKQKVLKLAAK